MVRALLYCRAAQTHRYVLCFVGKNNVARVSYVRQTERYIVVEHRKG